MSKASGFGGVKTGYAALPTVLFTLTPPSPGNYDNEIDAVAVSATSGAVYFADTNDGVFAFPNSGATIPLAKGQPTALYMVSTQGAKTLALDSRNNLYLAVYSKVINPGGGDTLAQITVDSLTAPPLSIGTKVNPSATLNPITAILNDSTCASKPAPSVTFSASASSTAAATAALAGSCSSTFTGAASFGATLSFTPEAAGADSIALTAKDQAGHTGSIAVTGVGNKLAQTITFANPGAQTVGKSLALKATSNSGLTVAFTPLTTKVCKVTGTTATFIAAGTCTIEATQSGNQKYAAAASVSDSFTVKAASVAPAAASSGAIATQARLALTQSR